MIKKFLLSTAAVVAFAGSAAAADLPSRRAPPVYVPPPPIPVFTWTGFYVGGQIGYEFGKSNASSGNLQRASSPSGVIGGAHVGYLYSVPTASFGGGFGGGLVLGVEGDVDGANYKSSYVFNGLTDRGTQDIQGSVRGRLGVSVDRALFYATGGVAFGGLSNSYTTGGGNTVSLSHTRVGYTVGGGVEYAFTPNWSARVEYRYTDFGSFSDQIGATTIRHRETDNRVQAGISYHFSTPIPVVARY